MARDSLTWQPILRSVLDHWVWSDKPFAYGQAWIDLILLAQATPIERVVRGKKLALDVGQLSWSKVKLAERWGWGRDRLDRFFAHLEAADMISVKTSGKTSSKTISHPTVITLNNYKELNESVKAKAAGKPAGKPTAKPAGQTSTRPAIIQKEEKKEEDLSPPSGDRPGPDEKGEGLPPTMGAGQETSGAPAEAPPAAAGDAKPKAPRKPDPIWDVLCEVFSLRPVTPKEKARIGAVVRDLRAKEATPDRIRQVHARMVEKGWEPFSPEGLVTWYDQFSAPAKPAATKTDVYVPRF